MKENKIKGELRTQSLVIKSIWNYSHSGFTTHWNNVLSKLPKNIYSFANRYLSNSLANATNAVNGESKSPQYVLFVLTPKLLVT